jgi:hypothetical protein
VRGIWARLPCKQAGARSVSQPPAPVGIAAVGDSGTIAQSRLVPCESDKKPRRSGAKSVRQNPPITANRRDGQTVNKPTADKVPERADRTGPRLLGYPSGLCGKYLSRNPAP